MAKKNKRFNFRRWIFQNDRILTRFEKRFARVILRDLKEQQKIIIANFKETQNIEIPDNLFDTLKEIIEVVGWHSYNAQQKLFISIQKSIFRDTFSSWLDFYMETRIRNSINLINDTTRINLEKILQRGFSQSIPFELIVEELENSHMFSSARAMRIVRTEIGHVNNQVKKQSVEDWSREIGQYENMYKIWIHRGAKNPRDWHIALDNGKAIPKDNTFVVVNHESGTVEHMDTPHSEGASLENVINCGCEVVYIPEWYAIENNMI